MQGVETSNADPVWTAERHPGDRTDERNGVMSRLGGIIDSALLALLLYKSTARMRRVCCYCNTEMGFKPCEKELDGQITHGICEPCLIKIKKEIKQKEEAKDGTE